MVAPENPFLQIVPRKNEVIINQEALLNDLASKTKKSLKGGLVIMLVGEYGIGKTLVADKVQKQFKPKAKVISLTFTNMIDDDIRNLPFEKKKDIVVIIDRFDLIDGMAMKDYVKILDLILERVGKGMTFVLLCTPEVTGDVFEARREFKARSRVVDVPPLDYEDAKKLVISRLNEVRKKKSKSLEPFTEKEIKSFWKKSKGNPRMLLLLCSSIYDKKMVGV